MNNFHANLHWSDKEMPPIEKFFRKQAQDGQALYIRGEDTFTMAVQERLHVDIVAASFPYLKQTGTISIEIKIRSQKYSSKQHEILIETRSCTIPGKETLGWIFTCRAQLLCIAHILDPFTFRIRVIDMPGLQEWFQERPKDLTVSPLTQRWFKSVELEPIKPVCTDRENKTESYPIPVKAIPSALILYDGIINQEGSEIKRLEGIEIKKDSLSPCVNALTLPLAENLLPKTKHQERKGKYGDLFNIMPVQQQALWEEVGNER